jgi:hypothetical protein
MSATPYAGLLERLHDADRNSVQRTLGSGIFGEAAEAISSLLNALEKISERCPPFDGDPYATPSDFGNSEDYAKHVEQMISSFTGDIARKALGDKTDD